MARTVKKKPPTVEQLPRISRRDGEPLYPDANCVAWRVLTYGPGGSKALRDEQGAVVCVQPYGEGLEGLPPGRYQLRQIDEHGRNITATETGWHECGGQIATVESPDSPEGVAKFLFATIERQNEMILKLAATALNAGIKPKDKQEKKDTDEGRSDESGWFEEVLKSLAPHAPEILAKVGMMFPKASPATGNGAS